MFDRVVIRICLRASGYQQSRRDNAEAMPKKYDRSGRVFFHGVELHLDMRTLKLKGEERTWHNVGVFLMCRASHYYGVQTFLTFGLQIEWKFTVCLCPLPKWSL